MKHEYKINGNETIIYIISKEETFRCLIDSENLEQVNQYKWHISHGYAVNKNKKSIHMHRLIMNCPDGLFVDHVNGNKLDNRKENLRIVTNQQNTQNRARSSNNKTGYRGVFFEKQTDKYRVQLVIDGVTMDFGRYDDVDIAGYVANHIIKNFMPYSNEKR